MIKTNSVYIAVFPSEIFPLDLIVTGIAFCRLKITELRRFTEVTEALLFRHV
jgi:hypothetical protein